MKKRLRKKKRIGEFQEFGFNIGFRFSSKLNIETRDNFIDRFLEKAIERNSLVFAGAGDCFEWNGFVALDKIRGSAINSHREVIDQWLIQESDILEYYVAPLIDAWYGDFDNIKKEWIKKSV